MIFEINTGLQYLILNTTFLFNLFKYYFVEDPYFSFRQSNGSFNKLWYKMVSFEFFKFHYYMV